MPLTKLSLQIGDETISWEITKEDCTTDEIIDGFSYIMIGSTFSRSSILSSMEKFVKEHKDE